MDEWMDGWIGGCMDELMNGWIVGGLQIAIQDGRLPFGGTSLRYQGKNEELEEVDMDVNGSVPNGEIPRMVRGCECLCMRMYVCCAVEWILVGLQWKGSGAAYCSR